MSFTEVRFPEDISYGSTGGPEFSTDVITMHNGREQRNMNWGNSRSRYNVAYGVKSHEQLMTVIDFFYTRRGRAVGFRFKDWSDFIAKNQKIGVGDNKNKVFQLVKIYKSGEDEYIRIIKKPVVGTVKVYLNSILNEKYSVDYSTGKITFDQPQEKDSVITADFEFDIPVRFDTDYLNASIDNYGSNSWNNIPLIEIK